MSKSEGSGAAIKRFCSVPERPVSMDEMKTFLAACKADDKAKGVPEGTTLAELAAGIPVGSAAA